MKKSADFSFFFFEKEAETIGSIDVIESGNARNPQKALLKNCLISMYHNDIFI